MLEHEKIDYRRKWNYLQEKIIDVLAGGAKTRDELVKILGIPRTTIFDCLKKLINKDLIERVPVHDYVPTGIKCVDCIRYSKNFTCSQNINPRNCKDTFKPRIRKKKGRPKILFRIKEGSE